MPEQDVFLWWGKPGHLEETYADMGRIYELNTGKPCLGFKSRTFLL